MIFASALVMSLMAPKTLYLSPSGSDQSPGTKDRPLFSLTKACLAASPGDTILLEGGVYAYKETQAIRFRGSSGAWLTIKAAAGAKPILDLSGYKPGELWQAADGGSINLTKAEFIRFIGVTVRNSYQFGFRAAENCRGLDFINCSSHGSFGPGIGIWNSSDVRITGCEVTGATSQRFRLYGDPKQECPHEAISIAGVKNFEASFNHVHDCEKEGIDVKEVSQSGKVHHNWVHSLPRQGLYCDAWFGLLSDVEFSSNLVHDCEWGFAVSVEGKESRLERLTVKNNILARSRASGIYFGTWGGNGPRSGIKILNNTVYQAGTADHWAGPVGCVDLRATNIRDILVQDNILVSGFHTDLGAPYDPASGELDRRGVEVIGNVLSSLKDNTNKPDPYGRLWLYRGKDSQVSTPQFADPSKLDFRLVGGSAGLSKGALPKGAKRLPPVEPVFPTWPKAQLPADWPEVIGRN
jgi:hypothetical protein